MLYLKSLMLLLDYILLCGILSNLWWSFGWLSAYLYEWVDGVHGWFFVFVLHVLLHSGFRVLHRMRGKRWNLHQLDLSFPIHLKCFLRYSSSSRNSTFSPSYWICFREALREVYFWCFWQYLLNIHTLCMYV